MAFDWSSIFDNYALKEVTKTDKSKGAYVLSADQRGVMSAARFEPVDGGNNVTEDDLITANVLFDPSVNGFEVSYYNSMREDGRSPETRTPRILGTVGAIISCSNPSLEAWPRRRRERRERLDFGSNQSIGRSSSRGVDAPLPRPATPAGLWVVGQQLGCPHKETHDDQDVEDCAERHFQRQQPK